MERKNFLTMLTGSSWVEKSSQGRTRCEHTTLDERQRNMAGVV